MSRALIRPILALLFALAGRAAASPAWPGTPPATPQPFPHSLALSGIAFDRSVRLAILSVMDVSANGKVAVSLHETRRTGDEWSTPLRVPSLGAHAAGEAAFSPDGRWLYFSSERPPATAGRPRAFRAAITNGAIGAPLLVNIPISPDAGIYFPRPMANGDLLFTSRGPAGGDDLFVARARESGFDAPEPLAGDFNSAKDDWDLVESADGDLRLWASARAGGRGRTDLWFSRRNSSGRWSPARNLAAVNTPQLETAPSLLPGDDALLFLRRVDGRDRLFWVRLASALEER